MSNLQSQETPANYEAIVTDKKTYYTSHFSSFVRTEKNLRGSVERHELLELIKNDGGVRDLCFALPSKYNVNGKVVIWEGASRHWCLEQLSIDDTYEGSLDIPFLVIPETIAESEPELIKFMLSSNSIDKRISPKEQWGGIKQLIDIYELEYADCRDPRSEATKRTAKELGKHHSWLQVLRRVYETNSNPKVVELLNEGVISGVDAADNLRVAAKKLNMPVETFIGEVLDHVHQAGKSKVTDTYIDQTVKTLTESAEDVKEQLDLVEEDEFEKEIEDILTEEDDREFAVDRITYFADFVKLLTPENWKQLDDKQLLAAAKKIDSITLGFEKTIKKSEKSTKPALKPAKDVVIVDIEEDDIEEDLELGF